MSRALFAGRVRTIAAWVLVGAMIADAPVMTIALSAQAPPPAQQPAVTDGLQQLPPGAQALPPEKIREMDAALEEELKRDAAKITGARIGTDGAPVSQTLEHGLIFTRNLWVAMLRKRVSRLEEIKNLTRAEKLALIDQIMKLAPKLDAAFQEMQQHQGPGTATRDEYSALVELRKMSEETGNTQMAQYAKAQMEAHDWPAFLRARDTFFGLIEQNEISYLAALYSDNQVWANTYLFETLNSTAFSTDPKTREDEMIAIFDEFLDANHTKLGKLATEAENITDFKSMLEFALPKYARVHQMAVAMSAVTGMTSPALYVYPLIDVGRSYTIATQMVDTARELFITIICLGSLAIPVVGAIVNAGVAIIEVTNEGGHLVVTWMDANNARRTIAITGASYVISEDDKLNARTGRFVFAVLQTGAAVPMVGTVVRDARTAQIARLRQPLVVDAPLSDGGAVQRGAQKAREMGMSEADVQKELAYITTRSNDENLQIAKQLGYTGDKAEDMAEAIARAELAVKGVTANAFSRIGNLEAFEKAALAAGVTQAEIDEMVRAARAVGTLKALGEELPTNLMRATLDKRGITVVVDKGRSIKVNKDGIPRETADGQMEAALDFFQGKLPARLIRGDMAKVLDLRSKLGFMREGIPVKWSPDDLSSLQNMMKRSDADLLNYWEFVGDEGTLAKIFNEDTLKFARQFLNAPNRAAVAAGTDTLAPMGLIELPPPIPRAATSSDPFSQWMVIPAMGPGSVARLSDQRQVPALDPGADLFSAADSLPAGPASTSTFQPGARRPTTGELERLAFDQVRTKFRMRTDNWLVSVLPDGEVAVTSPDGTRRVTTDTRESNGQYKVVFTTDKLNGRWITHTVYTGGAYSEVQVPALGATALDSLGVPTQSPSTAPANTGSAGTPSGGTGGNQFGMTPGAGGGTQRFDAVQYDTGLVSSVGISGTRPFPLSQEAIKEFQALAQSYSTEFGRGGTGSGSAVGPEMTTLQFAPIVTTYTAAATPSAGSENIWRPKVRTTNVRINAPSAAVPSSTPTFIPIYLNTANNAAFLNTASILNGPQKLAGRKRKGGPAVQQTAPTAIPLPTPTPGPDAAPRPTPTQGPMSGQSWRKPSPHGILSVLLARLGAIGMAVRSPSITSASMVSLQAGGQAPPRQDVRVFLTSLGESAGEAFKMVVASQGNEPVELSERGFVLEPVSRVTQAQIDQELQRLKGYRQTTTTIDGYCLEMTKLPPQMGMVFRIADDAAQRRFAAALPTMSAASTLMETGKLVGGTSEAYLHQLRQWAIWTHEEKFDEGEFGKAFLEHSKKNLAAARRPFTREIENALKQVLPGRWSDIQQVLQLAAQQR